MMIALPAHKAETPLDRASAPRVRVTPWGEEMAAHAGQAFDWLSFSGAFRPARGISPTDDPMSMVAPVGSPDTKQRQKTLNEEEWKGSKWFDERITYDPHFTEDRARAHKEWLDSRDYRDSLLARSPGGFGRTAAGLAVSLGVTALDPVNYLSFFGPAARVAAIARFGRIGGRVALGGTEAAIGTAIADLAVASDLSARGQEVTADDVAMDIVLGFGVGMFFGAGSGLLSARRTQRAMKQQVNGAAVPELVDSLAHAVEAVGNGQPVNVGPFFTTNGRARSRLLGSTTDWTSDIEYTLRRERGLEPGGAIMPVSQMFSSEIISEPVADAIVARTAERVRMWVPFLSEDGKVRQFGSETEARAFVDGKADARAAALPDGNVVSAKQVEASFVTKAGDETEIQTFRTQTEAKKFLSAKKRRELGGDLETVSFRDGARHRIAILRDPPAGLVDAIEAQPGLVSFPQRPRGADVQARAELRQARRETNRIAMNETIGRMVNGKIRANLDFRQVRPTPVPDTTQAAKAVENTINGKPNPPLIQDMDVEGMLNSERDMLEQVGDLDADERALVDEARTYTNDAEKVQGTYEAMAICMLSKGAS